MSAPRSTPFSHPARDRSVSPLLGTGRRVDAPTPLPQLDGDADDPISLADEVWSNPNEQSPARATKPVPPVATHTRQPSSGTVVFLLASASLLVLAAALFVLVAWV